jgi:hypothetical protein
MPRKQKSPSITQSIILDKNRCRFTTIDGRRCRMYRAKGHRFLCMTHAQQEEQILNAETVAAELIGPVHEYQTALCVNRTLGCLFNLIAQKRISNKDGALLAYVAQMLLQSVGSTIKDEIIHMTNERGENEWQANVVRAAEILSNDYTLRDKAAAEAEAENEETEVEEAPAQEPPTTEPAAEEPEDKPEETSEDEPKDEEPDTMIEMEEEAANALIHSLNPRP